MTEQTLMPWYIVDEEFPTWGNLKEKLRFLLNYAVLAPSGHNTQPWRFRLVEDGIEFYADRTRALPIVDPDDRELTISCGAALFHLKTAAYHFGYGTSVKTFTDVSQPDLLAHVYLGEPVEPDPEQESMFHAIPMRHTNRLPFNSRVVPEPLRSALRKAAATEGAWLHFVDGGQRQAVAELVAQGDLLQHADPAFRRELAAWLRLNRSRSRDGIPGYALGFGYVMSYLGPIFIRTFHMGKRQAKKDQQLVNEAPVLALLGTDEDDRDAWLRAGQALARVLLLATSEGLSASFLNQPIEVAELRPRLSEATGTSGLPQLLLRMGYGPQVRPTPRRSADEVLSNSDMRTNTDA